MANIHTAYLHSLVLQHQCHPLQLVAELTSASFCHEYLVYEHENEWAIGINKRLQLTVNHRSEVCDFEEKVAQVNPHHLCQYIHRATQTLSGEDWRLFGRADFEFSRFAHDLPQQECEHPLLELFVAETELRVTTTHVIVRTFESSLLAQIQAIITRVSHLPSPLPLQSKSCSQQDIVGGLEVKHHYQQAVDLAVNEIKTNQYKKVILSRPAILPFNIDITKSFINGRMNNTPARSFMLKLNNVQAFGFSPETVLEVDERGTLSTQPLAGTRLLPQDKTDAARLKNELLNDPKEIAEHAASVKLAIEELEQVCDPSSVHVSEFMTVSERGSVQHLASRVKGQLATDKSAWDAFRVLFPSITASGIPKREAIAAIARFEKQPRKLYSGSVFITDRNGFFDAALVLRAGYKTGSVSRLQAGAGIISLSNPQREWEETCEKMACVLNHLVLETSDAQNSSSLISEAVA
ncbi:salicylate synthase [Vibrio cholerae]|uniref:salicylate synthase n=1 Tax=Vibrio cholerae TaxID=666 RepID=UPI003015BE35|nr:salicylate synthase [Vibrio cholerae]